MTTAAHPYRSLHPAGRLPGQRVVVVGAGVTGLLTAVRCALLGHQVTVLDRGPIPNPASSSFDHHRAVRALTPGDVAATRRAAVAQRGWLELEALLGASRPGGGFFRRAGVVTAWPADQLATVTATAAEAQVRIRLVEPRAYPPVAFPAGWATVLEPDAGVLLAERVLSAAAGWLRRHPAVRLRPHQEVTGVDTDQARVVLADGTAEHGDLVLVAAGPWSPSIVEVPVVLHRQTMAYLRPPAELARWWESAPSAGRVGADGRGWLLPPGRGTLLKISTGAACRQVAAVDGGDDDEAPWVERIMSAGILSDVDRYAVVAVKRCHYAVDPGTGAGHLVRLSSRVWARAASGGDGFRTAPLVADQLAGALLGFTARETA